MFLKLIFHFLFNCTVDKIIIEKSEPFRRYYLSWQLDNYILDIKGILSG